MVTPISVMWQTICQDKNLQSTKTREKKRKGKGPARGLANGGISALNDSMDVERVVWLRFHPSAFAEVHKTICEVTSTVLAEVKKSSQSGAEHEVEIVDLRKDFNIFEIMGPKSSQVIKGALKPVADDKRKEFKEVSFCRETSDSYDHITDCILVLELTR